jgi:hypothetical protein
MATDSIVKRRCRADSLASVSICLAFGMRLESDDENQENVVPSPM